MTRIIKRRSVFLTLFAAFIFGGHVVADTSTPPAADIVSPADTIVELFQKQRGEFGDKAMRQLLNSLSEPQEEKPKAVEAVPTRTEENNAIVIIFAMIGLLVVGVLLVNILRRKQVNVTELSSDTISDDESTLTFKTDLTDLRRLGLANRWFAEVDQERLQKQADVSCYETAKEFIDSLGTNEIPSEKTLATAQKNIGTSLRNVVCHDTFLEILGGGQTPSLREDQSYYNEHLKALLPDPVVPQPSTTGSLRLGVLCVGILVGSLLGIFGGAFLSHWLTGFQSETGIIIGAPIGACLVVWLIYLIAAHPEWKPWIQGVLGTMAFLEATNVVLGALYPKNWIFRQQNTAGPIKRICAYIALMVLVSVAENQNTYDRQRYQKEIEKSLRQWFEAALAIIAVLVKQPGETIIEKSGSSKRTEDSKRLTNIAAIVQDFQETTNLTLLPREMERLIHELDMLGFDFSEPKIAWEERLIGLLDAQGDAPTAISDEPTEAGPVCWSEELEGVYEKVGIVRPGDSLIISRKPVYRDGELIRPGEVRKLR